MPFHKKTVARHKFTETEQAQNEQEQNKNLTEQTFLKACSSGSPMAASYALGIDLPQVPSLSALQSGLSYLILNSHTPIAQTILDDQPQLYRQLNMVKLFYGCAMKNNIDFAKIIFKNSAAYSSFNKFTLQNALELAARYKMQEFTSYLLFSPDFSSKAKPSFYHKKSKAFIFACEHPKLEYFAYLIHEVKVNLDYPEISLYLKKHDFSFKKELLAFFEFEKNYHTLKNTVPLEPTSKQKTLHKI